MKTPSAALLEAKARTAPEATQGIASMPLESDLMINVGKFHPNAVSEQTQQVNDGLIKLFDKGPKWYEVSDSYLLKTIPP